MWLLVALALAFAAWLRRLRQPKEVKPQRTTVESCQVRLRCGEQEARGFIHLEQ